jgi:hypothetical protein
MGKKKRATSKRNCKRVASPPPPPPPDSDEDEDDEKDDDELTIIFEVWRNYSKLQATAVLSKRGPVTTTRSLFVLTPSLAALKSLLAQSDLLDLRPSELDNLDLSSLQYKPPRAKGWSQSAPVYNEKGLCALIKILNTSSWNQLTFRIEKGNVRLFTLPSTSSFAERRAQWPLPGASGRTGGGGGGGKGPLDQREHDVAAAPKISALAALKVRETACRRNRILTPLCSPPRRLTPTFPILRSSTRWTRVPTISRPAACSSRPRTTASAGTLTWRPTASRLRRGLRTSCVIPSASRFLPVLIIYGPLARMA